MGDSLVWKVGNSEEQVRNIEQKGNCSKQMQCEICHRGKMGYLHVWNKSEFWSACITYNFSMDEYMASYIKSLIKSFTNFIPIHFIFTPLTKDIIYLNQKNIFNASFTRVFLIGFAQY